VIVVDANVLLGLYLAGPQAAECERLVRADGEWHVPRLWRSELRNVCVGVVRRGGLSLDDARRIVADAELRLAGREHEPSSDSVLELAEASGCSAYDCEYVAVARALAVPLVTFDRQVLRAFPRFAVSPSAHLA
jgi:predicted nucleic acid-binding protein